MAAADLQGGDRHAFALRAPCLQVKCRPVLSGRWTSVKRDAGTAIMRRRSSWPMRRATASIARSPSTPGKMSPSPISRGGSACIPTWPACISASLNAVGFVATGLRRSSGGGRPARLYRLSDRVVSFGFPPRRYELLSRLALEALAAGGSHADALRVCREAGVAEGERTLADAGRPPADAADAAEMVLRITEDQGLLPEIACGAILSR